MALRKILVGGGTGFVGRHLRDLLTSTKKYEVVNISRMPAVENMSWTDLDAYGLPENTYAVVNVAGQNFMDVTKKWTAGLKMNVQNSRVFTTKAISRAIQRSKCKPKVFVLVTGVAAYEPSQRKKYDESSPSTGQDFFSRLCGDWESAAQVDMPVRLVIIRSGVVLGRDGGMIKNMFLPFFLGLGGPIATGKQYLPWIHIEDLIRLIQFSIENDNVNGILNGVSPQIITNAEFTKAFAKAMVRPAVIPVPEKALNLIFHKERAMMLTKGQHVTPKRVMDYGFEYKFCNIDDACKDVATIFAKKRKRYAN